MRERLKTALRDVRAAGLKGAAKRIGIESGKLTAALALLGAVFTVSPASCQAGWLDRASRAAGPVAERLGTVGGTVEFGPVANKMIPNHVDVVVRDTDSVGLSAGYRIVTCPISKRLRKLVGTYMHVTALRTIENPSLPPGSRVAERCTFTGSKRLARRAVEGQTQPAQLLWFVAGQQDPVSQGGSGWTPEQSESMLNHFLMGTTLGVSSLEIVKQRWAAMEALVGIEPPPEQETATAAPLDASSAPEAEEMAWRSSSELLKVLEQLEFLRTEAKQTVGRGNQLARRLEISDASEHHKDVVAAREDLESAMADLEDAITATGGN